MAPRNPRRQAFASSPSSAAKSSVLSLQTRDQHRSSGGMSRPAFAWTHQAWVLWPGQLQPRLRATDRSLEAVALFRTPPRNHDLLLIRRGTARKLRGTTLLAGPRPWHEGHLPEAPA